MSNRLPRSTPPHEGSANEAVVRSTETRPPVYPGPSKRDHATVDINLHPSPIPLSTVSSSDATSLPRTSEKDILQEQHADLGAMHWTDLQLEKFLQFVNEHSLVVTSDVLPSSNTVRSNRPVRRTSTLREGQLQVLSEDSLFNPDGKTVADFEELGRVLSKFLDMEYLRETARFRLLKNIDEYMASARSRTSRTLDSFHVLAAYIRRTHPEVGLHDENPAEAAMTFSLRTTESSEGLISATEVSEAIQNPDAGSAPHDPGDRSSAEVEVVVNLVDNDEYSNDDDTDNWPLSPPNERQGEILVAPDSVESLERGLGHETEVRAASRTEDSRTASHPSTESKSVGPTSGGATRRRSMRINNAKSVPTTPEQSGLPRPSLVSKKRKTRARSVAETKGPRSSGTTRTTRTGIARGPTMWQPEGASTVVEPDPKSRQKRPRTGSVGAETPGAGPSKKPREAETEETEAGTEETRAETEMEAEEEEDRFEKAAKADFQRAVSIAYKLLANVVRTWTASREEENYKSLSGCIENGLDPLCGAAYHHRPALSSAPVWAELMEKLHELDQLSVKEHLFRGHTVSHRERRQELKELGRQVMERHEKEEGKAAGKAPAA